MIADSLRAARRALTIYPLALLGFAANVILGLIVASVFDDSDAFWMAVILPTIILLLISIFYMSRRAGDPSRDEVGSAGRWFGWGVVATLPALFLSLIYGGITGLEEWSNSNIYSLTEAVLVMIGNLIAIPFFSLSVGRTIDREGISVSAMLSFCEKNAPQILKAALPFVILPFIVAEAMLAWAYKTEPGASRIPVGCVYGTMLFVNSVLNIGLWAAIYRKASACRDP